MKEMQWVEEKEDVGKLFLDIIKSNCRYSPALFCVQDTSDEITTNLRIIPNTMMMERTPDGKAIRIFAIAIVASENVHKLKFLSWKISSDLKTLKPKFVKEYCEIKKIHIH